MLQCEESGSLSAWRLGKVEKTATEFRKTVAAASRFIEGAVMMETVNAFAVIDGGRSIKNGTSTPPTAQKPKLLDQVRQAIRIRHYSDKTEKAYVH
jgi:hypothetical protein